MLELQSLQKEQHRRELLLRIQKDDNRPIEVTVPLRKTIRSGTNHSDELRLNNNRDTLDFENDANDDDVGTTVADDIILMTSDTNNESTLSHTNSADNESRSTTITVNLNHISLSHKKPKKKLLKNVSLFDFSIF